MHLLLVRRRLLQGLQVLLVLVCLWTAGARGQGVELAALNASEAEGALSLDFAVRLTLPKAVEDALQRGVPLYFAAEARLLRSRWYWRDERVARVARSWRIAYQPLTNTWRVGLGGLHQTHDTLAEALNVASRSAGWKLVDLTQVDPGSRYYIEFSYRLDTTQLPGPMQFGLGGLGGAGDWTLGVERVLRLDPEK